MYRTDISQKDFISLPLKLSFALLPGELNSYFYEVKVYNIDLLF